MPRPTKGMRRKKLEAVSAWKRGDKKEAYKLWEASAKERKEHTEKKRNKKAKAAAEAAAAEAPPQA